MCIVQHIVCVAQTVYEEATCMYFKVICSVGGSSLNSLHYKISSLIQRHPAIAIV